MDGISKVIDELGLIILAKEVEIESQREEIKRLQQKIEAIEQYISLYDEYCEKEFNSSNL